MRPRASITDGIFSLVQPTGPPWGFTRVLEIQPSWPLHQCSRSQECGLSIKVQAMGPQGALAQMSFYIFMWNVITFGHDGGCPVTAIRAFMVLRGIRVFGDTCLQLKATGYADSRSCCESLGTQNKGLWALPFGAWLRGLVSTGPSVARPREGPLRRDSLA